MSNAAKAVFLSYAREDIASARRIAEALRAAGIEVWFDETELRGGDSWDVKIRTQIRECALFVPMISTQTQVRREGYFRREWKQAAERTRDMAEGTPFLLPVVVDATSERDGLVPDEFRSVQWTRLRGGEPHGAFCGRVKTLLESGTGVSPVSGDQRRDAHATAAGRTATFAGKSRRHGVFIFAGASVAIVAGILAFLAFRKSEPPGESRNSATAKSAAPAAHR